MNDKQQNQDNQQEYDAAVKLISELDNREWLSALCQRLCRKLKWIHVSDTDDNIHPLKAALLMLTLNLIINIPLAVYFKAAFPGEGIPGLFSEPADLVYEFIVHPVVVGYFFWLQFSLRNLFRRLADSKIIKCDEHFIQVLSLFRDRLHSRWYTGLYLLICLVATSWFVLAFGPFTLVKAPYESWVIAHQIIVWIRAPIVFVLFYATFAVLFDLVFYMLAMYEVFKTEDISLQTTNPDRAGGLGFVGHYSTRLSIIVAVLAFLFSLRMAMVIPDIFHFENLFIIIGFILFMVATPVIFIVPLLSAHSAMLSDRDKMLGDYSTRLNLLLIQLTTPVEQVQEQSLSISNEESIVKTKEILEQFNKLNEGRIAIRRLIPVWPFNIDNLKYLGSAIIIPIIPVVVKALLD